MQNPPPPLLRQRVDVAWLSSSLSPCITSADDILFIVDSVVRWAYGSSFECNWIINDSWLMTLLQSITVEEKTLVLFLNPAIFRLYKHILYPLVWSHDLDGDLHYHPLWGERKIFVLNLLRSPAILLQNKSVQILPRSSFYKGVSLCA